MKKYILLLFSAAALSAAAQVKNPDLMVIHYEGGLTQSVDLTGATYFEFTTQQAQKLKEQDAAKQLIGIWTYPLNIALGSGNTYVSGIDGVSLVFEENGNMHYVYKTSTYVNDDPIKHEHFSESEDLKYEVSDQIIKIVGVTELEYTLQYDYLTIKPLDGERFPPVYSGSSPSQWDYVPIEMTFHKEPSL